MWFVCGEKISLQQISWHDRDRDRDRDCDRQDSYMRCSQVVVVRGPDMAGIKRGGNQTWRVASM